MKYYFLCVWTRIKGIKFIIISQKLGSIISQKLGSKTNKNRTSFPIKLNIGVYIYISI